MRRFLRETWELFYWSLCCPSRLQQRMNEWSPAEKKDGQQPNTSANDILLFRSNARFIVQYFLISAVLSLPLAGLIGWTNQGWDWLLGLAALLISYSLGLWLIPAGIGFCSPLLLALTYWYQPQLFAESLQKTLDFLPPFSQLAIGIATGTGALIVTCWIGIWLRRRSSLSLAHTTFVVGSGLSVLGGSWLASQNWLITLSITGIVSFFLIGLRDQITSDRDAVVVAAAAAVTEAAEAATAAVAVTEAVDTEEEDTVAEAAATAAVAAATEAATAGSLLGIKKGKKRKNEFFFPFFSSRRLFCFF